MGKTKVPGRALVFASGPSTSNRGWPSSRACFASAVTVGRLQLPPTHPWKAPSRVMSATSPTWDETGGCRATTTASTKGSPRRASSEASSSSSLCIRSASRELSPRLFVILGKVDVTQGRFRPGDDRRLVEVAAYHPLGAAFARLGDQLGEKAAVVTDGRRIDGAVARYHQPRARRSVLLDDRRDHGGRHEGHIGQHDDQRVRCAGGG